MANLYSKNIVAFKSLNELDLSLLRWFYGCSTMEDLKYISEDEIDIANFLRDKKKQLNSTGFTEDDYDSGIPEEIYEEISAAIRSGIPDFNEAMENDCSEQVIISAICKFEKPHAFKFLRDNIRFSTKMVYLQDDEIFLGKYNLWEDLISCNNLRIKDILWLLNAISTLKCEKIKRTYVD